MDEHNHIVLQGNRDKTTGRWALKLKQTSNKNNELDHNEEDNKEHASNNNDKA